MNCKISEAKSNYKRIGDFIELVDVRNKGLKVTNLVGLSITKQFIKSVANTIGTNMENYKIIHKNQFACSIMQVRRDKKMPIALYEEDEPAIISQAYPVFKIIDGSKLLPEYLMMWFSRSEFDRHACFLAVGGVRGSLEWEDFLDMELPIPSIEKQRAIVKEYNTVVNRIKLNEQLNQKLEETAQALYKHWFVDFDFPNEDGKPYKSSGGTMVYNEEFDKEIPEGWGVTNYEAIFDITTGNLNSNAAVSGGRFPFFTCSSETFHTNTFSFECEALLLAGNNASAVYPFKYFNGKFDAYQRTYVITPKKDTISIFQGYFEIYSQLEGFKGTSSGTATKFLTMKILNPLTLIEPTKSITDKFDRIMRPLFERKLTIVNSDRILYEIESTILSKMTRVDETLGKIIL